MQIQCSWVSRRLSTWFAGDIYERTPGLMVERNQGAVSRLEVNGQAVRPAEFGNRTRDTRADLRPEKISISIV